MRLRYRQVEPKKDKERLLDEMEAITDRTNKNNNRQLIIIGIQPGIR
jgi:hypothetical protein